MVQLERIFYDMYSALKNKEELKELNYFSRLLYLDENEKESEYEPIYCELSELFQYINALK